MFKLRDKNNRINLQAGFSLVEIMVSLVLVSMLVGSMYGIIQNGYIVNGKSNLRTDAGVVAFEKVQDYINLDFENIPLGIATNSYEVEDFSAEAQGLKLTNASAKVYVEPESKISPTTVQKTVNYSRTITADAASIAGPKYSPVATHDAINGYPNSGRVSQDNIRDNNFSNYTYNSQSPGANNKPLPSIDLGSARDVDTIRIEWWSCNYGANNFRIEAKNTLPSSNSGWVTVAGGLSDNGITCSSSDRNSQNVDVSSNSTAYRYWRMYVVSATHPTWNVLSEFEAFGPNSAGDMVKQNGLGASSSPGALSYGGEELELSENGVNGQQSIGIIFDNVTAPNAANITSAYLEFTSSKDQSSPVSLRIRGVNTNNPPPWSGSFAVDKAVDSNNSDGLVGTSSSVTWDPAPWSIGEFSQDTKVNITSIVQEIVNRSGWTPANSMAFAVQYISGSGKRVAFRTPTPRLVVNWAVTTVNSESSKYVDLNLDGDVDNPTLVRVTSVVEYDAYGKRHQSQYSTLIRKYGIAK